MTNSELRQLIIETAEMLEQTNRSVRKCADLLYENAARLEPQLYEWPELPILEKITVTPRKFSPEIAREFNIKE